MDVQTAQREVFLGDSVGQAVSGLVWLISAAIGTWANTRIAWFTRK